MSRSGQEALTEIRELSEAFPEVQEWLGGPPGCLSVFSRPSRMFGSGGRPSRMSVRPRGYPGVVRRPSRMSGSGWETLMEVREISGSVRKALLDVPGALLDYRKCSGGSHGCPGVVGKPSRTSERASRHPGGPFEHSRTFERASRTSGRVSRQLLDIREGLPPLLDVRQRLPTTPGHSGGPPDHSRTSGKASHHSWTFGSVFQPLLDIREGLPTTPKHL